MVPMYRFHVLKMLSLMVVYILLGKLSLSFAMPPGNASPIWPVAGIAVASSLMIGYRVLPVILIGAIVVNAGTDVSAGVVMCIGLGNTLETFLTAWLTKRYICLNRGFSHSEDVPKFVYFALLGSLVSSTIGLSAMFAGGYVAVDDLPLNWITWAMGDLTGITIVAPALLAWRTDFRPFQEWRKFIELLLFVLTLSICTVVVFKLSSAPLLFLFVPLMTWTAFRFSQSEVTKINLLLAIGAILGALNGTGPLGMLPLHNALLILLTFVSILGISGLAISVTVSERSSALCSLRKIQDELESLVEQRTTELSTVADKLRRDIVAREKIEMQLKAKEKQLEEAQHLAHLGSWEWDPINDRLIMSNEMIRIYGVPEEQQDVLTYKMYLNYIPPDECPLVYAVVKSALSTGQPFTYEHHVLRPNGTVRYLRCRGKTEKDETGNVIYLYGTAHDLTEEKRLEENLQEAEELYHAVVEFSPDAIYLLRSGLFTFSNKAGAQLVGASDNAALIGRPFIDFVTQDSRHSVAQILAHVDHSPQPLPIETKLITANNAVIDVELAAIPFCLRQKHDTLVVARDISERKRAQLQIQHLAHHDYLTGLANRKLFMERAEYAISRARRTEQPLAILFIDLDRFKSINDTAGHSVGDQVLRECSSRLRSCLRDSDTIARAGGDEFLILIESISHLEQIPTIAHKIIAAVSKPFNVAEREYMIGASIGISIYPQNGDDTEALIRYADIAMYRAKTEGQGSFRIYTDSMSRHSLERYNMEAALRRALERDELELYFQPKLSLRTGGISGAEALIRWNHPEYGLLMPYRFISLAEDLGLVSEMGLWAIREVCKHCHDWHREGLPTVRIAVNVAYSQFTDEAFCNNIEATLRHFDLPPSQLELELTETMVMQNAPQLMGILKQIKSLGVHLSVDDFGTGYSSLAYLKRLPVDSVKVDRSFIRDLPNDLDDVAITRAVMALVHSLKRSVVAEGVETHEQLQFLIENECDEVQGFYFSEALPDKEFRLYLKTQNGFYLATENKRN